MERESPEVRVLRLLRESEYTSGEAISRALGISRTAVWKHIKGLRKEGFSIEASPSKGYRLSGEVPFSGAGIISGLKTEIIGSSVHFSETLGSTNSKALELARGGAEEGTVVVSDSQTSGRGRLGRTWVSPPGANLHTSVILRPPVHPSSAHELTFVAAVATAEAVSRFVPARPTVKWPNDVQIDGMKVAGILLEMDSEVDRVKFVVVGVGVNLNVRAAELPVELAAKATSVRDKSGCEVSRVEFAHALYSGMEKWYKVYLKEGFQPVLSEWRGFFDTEGKPVSVASLGATVEGMCAGVDRDGSLLVRTSSGDTVRVLSGDLETGT